jgi:hypothetical protein
MPVFRKEMPVMAQKYKILWFVVDLYHRQRYFFICGCNETATNPARRTAGRPLREETSRLFHSPVSRSLSEDSPFTLSGCYTPDQAEYSPLYLPIEEVL